MFWLIFFNTKFEKTQEKFQHLPPFSDVDDDDTSDVENATEAGDLARMQPKIDGIGHIFIQFEVWF